MQISGDAVEDLVGGLGPHERLGSSFHASIHDRIERVSSPTERWVLRRNQVVINAENQRSTRFSQEL